MVTAATLDPMTARVMALETILTEKGLVDPAALDAIVELYEHQIGPRNGARVVARAWSDPGLRRLAAPRRHRRHRLARLRRAAGRAHAGGVQHARASTT